MFADIVQDESYDLLQKVSGYIIQKFEAEGFTEGIDDKMILNSQTKIWSQNFHATMIRAIGKEMLDSKAVMKKFDQYDLGTVDLNEVHLSSRNEFETPDGTRMKRDLFSGANHGANYACESKIMLSFDHIF